VAEVPREDFILWLVYMLLVKVLDVWCIYGLAVLLWPYLLGSDDAPATAKRGEEKKVLSAVSISSSRF
jgi:hypothetical protein